MSSQAFSLAVWESLFPACVVRGRANLLLSFHSAAPIPLQSLSVFSLLLAVAGQQEEAPSLFHISSPLKYPLDVVLPFSYIRGRFVYCPFFLVQFTRARGVFFGRRGMEVSGNKTIIWEKIRVFYIDSDKINKFTLGFIGNIALVLEYEIGYNVVTKVTRGCFCLSSI